MQSMTVTFTIKTVGNNKHIQVFVFFFLPLFFFESQTVYATFLLILHNNNGTMLFCLDTTTSAYMYAIIAVRQCIITTT